MGCLTSIVIIGIGIFIITRDRPLAEIWWAIIIIGVGIAVGLSSIAGRSERKKPVYCAACGQRFSPEDVPRECPRCKSNRFSHKDPGAI